MLWYILNLIELYPRAVSYKQHKDARRALKTPNSDPPLKEALVGAYTITIIWADF